MCVYRRDCNGVPFLSFVFEIVFLPVFVYLCVCVLEEGLQYIGVSCCQIAARQRPVRTQHHPAEGGKLRKWWGSEEEKEEVEV